MGDEEDALALLGEGLHRRHKLVDLLRSEDGGRLVEDEDLVVAVEHLQNLHALLHTDGDILDLCVEVDVEPVPVRELLDLFAGLLLLKEAELRRLRAENDVIENGEDLDKLEMLMHHSYAEGGGVVRVLYPDLLAVFEDNALLRLIETEKNAHQRGFSGSVFAQKCVDLAPSELEGDIVVGLDSRELLRYMKHLDNVLGRTVHKPSPAFPFF